MRKRLQALRQKLGIPSGRAIIHIILIEIAGQLLWNWASKMVGLPLVRDIGYLVVFIAVLFAAAWYLPKISPRLTGASSTRKEKQSEQQNNVNVQPINGILPTDFDRKYVDWMATAFNRDKDNFPRCLFVSNLWLEWKPLRETDSHFLVHCDVFSSSVFRLDIGKKAEGHVIWGNEPIEKEIEVLTGINGLERSTAEHLALRQWVSASRMNWIAANGGKEERLVFQDVNVWVEARYPDGSIGPKFRLPIPHEVKIRVPTRNEVES